MKEPLIEEPKWKQDNSGNYYKNNAGMNVPESYAEGVEDGAYALAKVLNDAMDNNKPSEALFILLSYKDGLAKPVKNWKHAPRRR